MKLYVINVDGVDSQGKRINGFITISSVIDPDNFELYYEPINDISPDSHVFQYIMTQYDSRKLLSVCDNLQAIFDDNGVSLTATVIQHDFTKDQISMIAKQNQFRHNIAHSGDKQEHY